MLVEERRSTVLYYVADSELPYFSIDNAHLMYNAHPKGFRNFFDVLITRMTLTSGRIRKYRPLLTEDTGVIPENMPD
jgi:hypothetical protein